MLSSLLSFFSSYSQNKSTYEFSEGDLFYCKHKSKYVVYKLLKHDIENETYHVINYHQLDDLPTIEGVEKLEIFGHHSPINKHGFKNPKLIISQVIKAEELKGYHEYLKLTKPIDLLYKIAKDYYLIGNSFADKKAQLKAIDEYSKAIDLIPEFIEAIDNRAFCEMELGNWNKAIKGFEQSLKILPKSTLAEFSIGECYLRLLNYDKALVQFEKTLKIDPSHSLSKEFIKNTKALIK